MIRSVSALLVLAVFWTGGFLSFGLMASPRSLAAAPVDAPKVVVTLKPVHSIVAAVLSGIGEPDLLLDGLASPHSFQLSPDHIRQIAQADMVFLIDKDFESFLQPSLKSLVPKGASVIELSALPGIDLMASRGDPLSGDGNAASSSTNRTAEADHPIPDFHIWLSLHNAIAMTHGIAAALCDRDPGHCAAYERNAAGYAARLEEDRQKLAHRLAGLQGRAYMIHHDSLQYFEAEQHLGRGVPVMARPEGMPSARRLHLLRRYIEETGLTCLLVEPQFPQKLTKVLTEGMTLTVSEIDVLGADLAPGPDAYPALLFRLADRLAACLN